MFFANLNTIATCESIRDIERLGIEVYWADCVADGTMVNIDDPLARHILPLDVYDTRISISNNHNY